MSKYQPLAAFLAAHAPDTWKASFAEVEAALGSALPKMAREKAAWWWEAEKPHANAWTAAGWAVDHLDLAAQTVTFRRHAPPRTAAEVMSAADAAYGRVKAADTARKVGLLTAAVGAVGLALGAGLSLLRRRSERG